MAKKQKTKAPPDRWLVLVHQLPVKPAYARVKIWRRLKDAGAVALKNSVYVLPASAPAREIFSAIAREIEKSGGDGLIYDAELVGGMRDGQLRGLFNQACDADYQKIIAELRTIASVWKAAKKAKADPVQALGRISQRLIEVAKTDFFGAPARASAEALLAQLEHSHLTQPAVAERKRLIGPTEMTGKVWVTRQDIHVDRIACAWLIKRFIDPEGTLRFVPGKRYETKPGELGYDMPEAEFTHEDDACSFETLLSRALITDPALKTIAEIIHDIDLKDGKFAHPETPGIAHVISGICRTQGHDEARVARGAELLDDIYEQFRRKTRKGVR